MPRGRRAVILLFDSWTEVARCLEFRPDYDEVIALGQAVLRIDEELTQLCRSRRIPRAVENAGVGV